MLMLRENLTAQMLRGERIDPNDLIKLDEALKRYLPQGKPLKVEVEFIDSLPSEPSPTPPGPPPSPPTPPNGGGNLAQAETSPAPTASNVVPLKRSAAEERAHMERACAPPIKRGNEVWRAHVGPYGSDPYGGACDPFGTYGPIPNFGSPYRGR
jgi:hypothetical protein